MKFVRFYTALWLSLVVFGFCDAARAQSAKTSNQPSYNVTMVPRTILAINYQNRTKTEIDFQGSPLMPLAKGTATVESKNGRIAVDAELRALEPASKFGEEYLTYVLWAITPEGRANNLGELLVSGGKSKLQATTTLQTFGLIVTAEPFYAVAEPSDAVVLENVVAPGTTGSLQQVNVNYQLFKRGTYSYNLTPAETQKRKSKVPLEMTEARNAVAIAMAEGSQQYAADVLAKAERSLNNAEGLVVHGDRKEVVQYSRDAIQNAAEAIQTTIIGKEQEAREQERAAAAQRTAAAQQQAAEAAEAQKQAELQQQQEALAAQKAQLAQQAAEQKEEQERLAQQAAEQKAQQDAQAAAQAQQAAQQAQQQAAQAEQEKEQLRASLLEQFNRILPTVDTPRGLKVNLGDVLFDTGKYDLRPMAREALAKFSGIVIAHPGLKLQVDGYTDSVGDDAYNMTLSENRANSVRAYLVNQGIDPSAITATGYGKADPVAGNDTAQGRQQNRRVEIIISGEVIGTKIGPQGGQPQGAGTQAPTQ